MVENTSTKTDKALVTRSLLIANFSVHLILYFLIVSTADSTNLIMEIYDTFGLVPATWLEKGFYWQPLTALFLHGGAEIAAKNKDAGDLLNMWIMFSSFGLLHVGVNMLALWSLGDPIEKVIGSFHFFGLYFVSALCGSISVVVIDHALTRPTVGASGAILGLLGALAVFFPNARLLFFFIPMKVKTAALITFIASLYFIVKGGGGFLSHTGHLGGLIGGILYARFVLGLRLSKKQNALPAASRNRRIRFDPISGRFTLR